MNSRPKLRRKKGWRHQTEEAPFPVPIQSVTNKPACNSRWFYYRGELVDGSVLVQKEGDGHFLYKMGFFGKGILSRGKPEHAFFVSSYQGHRRKSLPAGERRFQQSRFQKVRQHRYQRHLSWKKMRDEDENLSNNAKCGDTEEAGSPSILSEDPEKTGAGSRLNVVDERLPSSEDDGEVLPKGKCISGEAVCMDSNKEQASAILGESRSRKVPLVPNLVEKQSTRIVQPSCSGDEGKGVVGVRGEEPDTSPDGGGGCGGEVMLGGQGNIAEKESCPAEEASPQPRAKQDVAAWTTDVNDWSRPLKGPSGGEGGGSLNVRAFQVCKDHQRGTSKGERPPKDNDWDRVNLDDWTIPSSGGDKKSGIERTDIKSGMRNKMLEPPKRKSSSLNDDSPERSSERSATELASTGDVTLRSPNKGEEDPCSLTRVGKGPKDSGSLFVPGNRPVSTSTDGDSRKRLVGAGHSNDEGHVKRAKVFANEHRDSAWSKEKRGGATSDIGSSSSAKCVVDKMDAGVSTIEGRLGQKGQLKDSQTEGGSHGGDSTMGHPISCSERAPIESGRGEPMLGLLGSSEQIGAVPRGNAGTSSQKNVADSINAKDDSEVEDSNRVKSLAGQSGLEEKAVDSLVGGCDEDLKDDRDSDILSGDRSSPEDDTTVKEEHSHDQPEEGTRTKKPAVKSPKVVRRPDPYPVQEFLQLSYEEAFFLSYGLGCLSLSTSRGGTSKLLDISEMWREFRRLKPRFPITYICYHYYRSKGWVPRSGTKYGCDFVIYKQGPTFYHSSFAVLAELVAPDSEASTTMSSWANFTGFSRIVENSAKDVLICSVIYPENFTEEQLSSPACIPHMKVREVSVKRWRPTRERERKDYPPLIS